MKKGISRWSLPADLPLEECFRKAKGAGFDGLELSFDGESGELTFDTTPEQAGAIRRMADDAGIGIVGVATGYLWGNPLTSGDDTKRNNGIAAVSKMLDIARWLAVDAILVVPGAVDVFFLPDSEVVDYETAWQRSREAVGGLVEKAEANGVAIGLENVWNKFLLSPLEMRAFIDSFNSPFVGSYFDAGNVLLTGYPEQWIRILGGRIKRVHVKDYRKAAGGLHGFVDLGEGDVNWPAVMKALKDTGYDGWITAEIIPPAAHCPDATLWANSVALDYIIGRK